MRPRLPTIGPAFAAVGNAYANIIFTSNVWLGWALLAVTFVRPLSGLAGLISVMTANLVAGLLGYRVDAIRSGYYGFNALLLGLVLSVGHGLDTATVLLCVLAGAGATLLTAFLGDALHRGFRLPILVLPFVIIATLAAQTQHDVVGIFRDLPIIAGDLRVPGTFHLILHCFGSLFFQPSLLAGALVFAACLMASRVSTVVALGGIGVALITLRLLHPGAETGIKLAASYNAALTSIAVGTFFFVPSRAALVAAIAAAALAAWLSCALTPLLGDLKVPILAWPFILVTFVTVRALQLKSPDRAPYPPPLFGQSPEANLEHVATYERRFGIPGPPQLYLPVSGSWFISQGADGEHTHQSAWRGALDFEIVDGNGFPFRDQGMEAADYYAFDAPVYSPGAGTVAAVHDGLPDNRPGEVDAVHSWGNAVVIQHGPELFSVVAHLKCGSIAVKPGQSVFPGQLLAACGASGRSPRPHLHLQAQRSAELGAPAIPFRLHHYTTEESQKLQHYRFLGLPEEGEHVASVVPNPLTDAFAAMPPGQEITLVSEADGQKLRLKSDISLLGERSLLDLDRRDRLFFQTNYGCLTFTTYVGRADAPLRALFLALPRLPSVIGAQVRFVDEPPPALLLPRPVRWLYELVRVVFDPVRTRAEMEINATADGIVVSSDVGVGIGRTARTRYRSRTVIDTQGIVEINVVDLRRSGTPMLHVRRQA